MAETNESGSVKEIVLIQSGDCAVTFFPQLGGKVASISVGGRELLQDPLSPYAPRSQTMPFEEGDASGWDECLPSVAACKVDTGDGHVFIPDHGDLWRIPWELVTSSSMCATFRARCFSLPLEFYRVSTLLTTEKGWHLRLDYKLTNVGRSAVPWSWAAHPLFVTEPGDRIVLPDTIRQLRLEYSRGGRLGQADATVKWPMAELAKGGETDLSLAQPPESGFGDKLFAGPLAPCENSCTLERPSVGLRIRLRFSPVATPFLGLWICSGGWPDRPGTKQVCVALEPATAPVDSLAQTGPWSRVLAAGESVSWPMIVEIESI